MDDDRRLDQARGLRFGRLTRTTWPACRPGTTSSSRSTPATRARLRGPRRGLRDQDGGATWKTIGPYWNFGFLLRSDQPDGDCPPTTHPDQHGIAISAGTVLRRQRRWRVHPPARTRPQHQDAGGHATDWSNHNAGLRTLQYYSAGTGRDPTRRGSGHRRPAGQRRIAVACPQPQAGLPVRRRRRRHHRQPAQRLPRSSTSTPSSILWLTKNCRRQPGNEPGSIFDITVPDMDGRFTSPFRVVRGSKNIGDGVQRALGCRRQLVLAARLRLQLHPRSRPAADDDNGWKPQYTLDDTGLRLIVGMDGVADPAAPADPSQGHVHRVLVRRSPIATAPASPAASPPTGAARGPNWT